MFVCDVWLARDYAHPTHRPDIAPDACTCPTWKCPPVPIKETQAMKFWFDTEFIEDGKTIDLISIGIVAEDDRELYLVNGDAPWPRISKHTWLMNNVVPHLPQPHGDWRNSAPKRWLIDFYSPLVKRKPDIANEVREFLTQHGGPVELWGYYSAYDHVVLAQLWGTMIQLPRGLPMWTNDVQQVAAARGLDNSLPQQTGTAHNALDDARWTRKAWTYLQEPTAA